MPKITKAAVHWIKKAPTRNCLNCAHRKGRKITFRGREYTEGHMCGLHGWRTLANAICDDWKKGEEDGQVCKVADTD